LPRFEPGDWYLILQTNNEGSIFEGTGHSNNLAARPIRIVVPDLSVVQPAEPIVATAGQSFEWGWTVTNDGLAAAAGSWGVTTFLSRDSIWTHDDIGLDTWSPAWDSPALAPTERLTQVRTAELPDVAPGQWYLLVVADWENSLYEAAAEANNIAVRSLTIRVPDLNVENLSAPQVVTIGGKFDASWRVQNSGTGDFTYEWTTLQDSIYLSRDGVIDGEDIRLGAIDRTGPLAAGAAYDQSSTFAVPRLPGGRWNLILRAESQYLWENHQTANNVLVRPIVLADPDLAVQSVSVPSNGSPGRRAEFSWTVVNQGGGSAEDRWRDSIYVSADQTLDSADRLLAEVDHTGPLSAGAVYTATSSLDLPALMPGTYYLIVRTDSRQQLIEGLNEENNLGSSTTGFALSIPRLQLDQTVSDQFTAPGQSHYYEFTGPAGKPVLLTLDTVAASGLSQLYARMGELPTRAEFDLRDAGALQPDQQLVIPAGGPATYYVLVHTRFGAASTSSYSLRASSPEFRLQEVAPRQVNNSGLTTLAVRGTELEADAIFQLVAGDSLLIAQEQQYTNSILAYATFDFTAAPPGDYDLQAVRSNGGIVTLPQAVRVAAGDASRIEADISVPSLVRRDRLATAFVRYANTGQGDAAAPLLLVLASTPVEIGLVPDLLVTTDFFPVLGTSPSGPASVLRPGQEVRLPLYFRENQLGRVRFEVVAIPSDDPTAFDAGVLEDWFNTADVPESEREAVWSRVRDAAGATWGSFVQLLGRDARLLPRVVGDNRILADVLQLEVWKARAEVGTSIQGRVVATGTWRDFGGKIVRARNLDTAELFELRLLLDGSFVFPRVSAGEYELDFEDGEVLSTPRFQVGDGESVSGLVVALRATSGASSR
jgi:hypothetical protein